MQICANTYVFEFTINTTLVVFCRFVAVRAPPEYIAANTALGEMCVRIFAVVVYKHQPKT